MKNFILILSLITFLGFTVVSQAEIVYLHNDALGSPIMETNELGAVISRSHYKPFGETLEQMKDGVGYTGHVNDADLGLTYMQARYYDPVIGRFYSNDPVGYTAQNPVMSFNRYLYVNNNPYKYTDPDGEFLLGALYGAIAGAVGGAITGAANGDWKSGLKGAAVGALAGAAVGLLNPAMSGEVGVLAAGAITNVAASAIGQVAGNVVNGNSPGENFSTVNAVGAAVGGLVVAKVASTASKFIKSVPQDIIGKAINANTTAKNPVGNTVGALIEGAGVGVGEGVATPVVEKIKEVIN